jgi:hypothetical protein
MTWERARTALRWSVVGFVLASMSGGCCKCGSITTSGPAVTRPETQRETTAGHLPLNNITPAWRRTPWADSDEPQLDDLEARFASAAPFGGPLRGDLVLCQLTATGGGNDVLSAPDLGVTYTLPDGTTKTAKGPEDESAAIVSVGGIHLARGARMELTVYDDDAVVSDFIGRTSFLHDGFPVTFSEKTLDGACRVLPMAQLQSPLAAASKVLDDALTLLEKSPKPTPKKVHWGYPREIAEGVGVAFRRVAAFVGWNAEELAEPRRRYEAFVTGWQQAFVASRAAALATAGKTVTLAGDLTVTVTNVTCDDKAVTAYGRDRVSAVCVVELEIVDGSNPVLSDRFSVVEGITIAGVDDAGVMTPPDSFGVVRAGKVVGKVDDPRSTERVLVEPLPVVDLPNDTLLWVETGGDSGLLRILP